MLSNGWYKFTDYEARYSISYPPEAYLDAQHQAGLEFKQARILFPRSVGDANQEMEVAVFSNPKGSSLPEIVEREIYHGRLPKGVSAVTLTPTKVAGLDAAKLELTPFYPAVLVSAKNRVYFIALPMNLMWANAPTRASVDLYYEIINTFSLF